MSVTRPMDLVRSRRTHRCSATRPHRDAETTDTCTAGHRKTTRKQFFAEAAAITASFTGSVANAGQQRPNVLAVVAHPDDEYAFAAFAYRISHELNGTVDQIVITNGEAGYRYSQLAEVYYGLPLTSESVGRTRLPAIRRQETERAGRILGVRKHWFLDQRDARFTLDSTEAFSGIWNTEYVSSFIAAKLREGRYDFVVVMLPTSETHGHHQAAALLTLRAMGRMKSSDRPVLLAAEASGHLPPQFASRSDYPQLRAETAVPAWRLNRLDAFRNQPSLNYAVVVNWVIAEHKSQGLFQTEAGRHPFENFWLFRTDTPDASRKANDLFRSLNTPTHSRI